MLKLFYGLFVIKARDIHKFTVT